MKTLKLLLAILLLAAPLAAGAQARDPDTYFFNPLTGDLKAELADAKSGGKKGVFLMFEQEGCPGCAYMKANILNRVEVQRYYRERFLNFSVDIYGAVPLNDFAGRDRTEKGYALAVGVKGTPTLVFYDLDGKEVVRLLGAVQEVDEFLLLGEFVSSGAYKTQKFAEYRQQRQRNRGS